MQTIKLLLLLMITVPTMAQVSNDLCENAILLNCGESHTSSTNQASSIDNPIMSCNFDGGPGAAGVWYKIIGNGQNMELSLCNSSFDTKINIYEGSCGSFTCLGSNDDYCGSRSQFTFYGEQGVTYYALVNGFSTESIGNFTLTVNCTEISTNDICEGSIPLVIGEVNDCSNAVRGDLNESSTAPGFTPKCANGNNFYDLWYSFNTGDYERIRLSIDNLEGSNLLFVELIDDCNNPTQIYEDNCFSVINQDFTTVFGDLPLNEDFFIRISTSSAFGGWRPYTVCLSEALGLASNDQCHSAQPLICGEEIVASIDSASKENNPLNDCDNGEVLNNVGLWYTVQGTGELFTIDLCDSEFDTELYVYQGACGTLECEVSNDDACGSKSRVNFISELGKTYYVFVTGHGTATGEFVLKFDCSSPVPNDFCSGATEVKCGTSNPVNSTDASPDERSFLCASNTNSNGVWYKYVGIGKEVTMSICNTAVDTRLHVLQGEDCSDLDCIAIDDDSEHCPNNPLASEVTFMAEKDETYYILIDGYNEEEKGTMDLNVSCDCEDPEALSVGLVTDSSAVISWKSSNFGAFYEVRFAPLNTPFDLMTAKYGTIDDSLNQLVLRNLADTTIYKWQVLELCDGITASDTIEGLSFTTPKRKVNTNIADVDLLQAQVFPNPSEGEVFVQVRENAQYQLRDMAGQLVMTGELSAYTKESLDVSFLADGVYFVEIFNEQQRKVERLVKR